MGGMNTSGNESRLFSMPAPSAPDSAMASSTEGKAKNMSIVRMTIVLKIPPT